MNPPETRFRWICWVLYHGQLVILCINKNVIWSMMRIETHWIAIFEFNTLSVSEKSSIAICGIPTNQQGYRISTLWNQYIHIYLERVHQWIWKLINKSRNGIAVHIKFMCTKRNKCWKVNRAPFHLRGFISWYIHILLYWSIQNTYPNQDCICVCACVRLYWSKPHTLWL